MLPDALRALAEVVSEDQSRQDRGSLQMGEGVLTWDPQGVRVEAPELDIANIPPHQVALQLSSVTTELPRNFILRLIGRPPLLQHTLFVELRLAGRHRLRFQARCPAPLELPELELADALEIALEDLARLCVSLERIDAHIASPARSWTPESPDLQLTSGTGGSLLDAVRHHVLETPDAVWLHPPPSDLIAPITWNRAWREAGLIAAHLQSLDLPPQSRVAIMGANSPYRVVAELAVFRAGFVVMPIAHTVPESEARRQLEVGSARVVMLGKEAPEANLPDVPIIALPEGELRPTGRWSQILEAVQVPAAFSQPEPEAAATLHFTAGTTGPAQPVEHTWADVNAVAEHLVQRYSLTSNDQMFAFLPQWHASGHRWTLASMQSGMPLFFGTDETTFIPDLKRIQPTLFMAPARVWQALYTAVEQSKSPKQVLGLANIPLLGRLVKRGLRDSLGLLKTRATGALEEPLAAEVVRWFQETGDISIEPIFGTTESFYSVTDFEYGTTGELLIKGPTSPDTWLLTGDRAEFVSLEQTYVHGPTPIAHTLRLASGKEVLPDRIEQAFEASALVDHAYIGGDERPYLFAVVSLSGQGRKHNDPQHAIESLLSAVSAQLPRFQCPRFVVLDNTPWTPQNGMVTPTLRVCRRRVEAQVREHLDGWYEDPRTVRWL